MASALTPAAMTPAAALGVVAALGCAALTCALPAGEPADVTEWKAKRHAQCCDPEGWLTVIGLHWLKTDKAKASTHTMAGQRRRLRRHAGGRRPSACRHDQCRRQLDQLRPRGGVHHRRAAGRCR